MSAAPPNRHRRSGPAFRERPTREQIAELPPFDPLPLERIVIVETAEQAEAALRAMTRARFVGFDTESKPTFTRDAVRDGPHVIQFATAEQGFIVQVNDRTPIAFLREVLESEAIVKVGFGLDSDRGPLEHKLHTRLHASVEVSQVLRSLGHKQALGAKAAVAVVLGRRMTKSKSVTTSNWGAARLSPQQLLYAANDAYAALKVFEAMGSPYP
jgi:ribonuclease D